MAIFSLLSLALVMMFSTSRTVGDRGSAQVDLHRQTRELVRKIAPMIMAVIPDPANGIDSGIVAAGTDMISFTTTEYLLEEEDDTFVPAVDPPRQRYRIRLDNGGNGDVVLEKLHEDDSVDADVEPRVLVSGSADVRITRLNFAEVKEGVVQISIGAQTTVRDATRQTRDDYSTPTNNYSTIIEIPHFSAK